MAIASDCMLAQCLVSSKLDDLHDGYQSRLFSSHEEDLSTTEEEFRREIQWWEFRGTSEQDKASEIQQSLSRVPSIETLYPSIYVCLVTLLTLPVSSASAECLFSVMRRVKTYNRSSMTLQRLSGLALSHTYRDFKFKLDEPVIKFALSSNRKLELR